MKYKLEESTSYHHPKDSASLNIIEEKQRLADPIVAIRTKEGLISRADICQVDMLLHLMHYAAHENCGYCSLGRIGTKVMYEKLKDIFAGKNENGPVTTDSLEILKSLGNNILSGALCSFCQFAAQMALESINQHLDHYEAHLAGEHNCRKYDYNIIHFTNCQLACPLKTDVAFFFQSLVTENVREGKSYLQLTNIFPEILATVCGYCKGNCTYKKTQGKPLPIEQIKGYLCNIPTSEVPHPDQAPVLDRVSFKLTNALHKSRYQETDKTVGIVGAGPGGLAAAIYLAQMGYRATVFDSEPTWGGTMRTGIPEYRLDNDMLEHDIHTKLNSRILGISSDDTAQSINYIDRISFSFNTGITTQNFHKLLAGFDRLILASGTLKNRLMGIPGEDYQPSGMVDPLLLMKQVNTEGGLRLLEPGTKVIVIGGGNVAIDCAREAKRIGCDTWIYYRRTPVEMPADEEEYEEALHEGVQFAFKMWPKEIKSRQGKVTHMLFTDKTDPDNPKQVEVKVDYIITAAGQLPDLDFLPADLELKVERGNPVIDDFLKTSNNKIYIAGDLSWNQPKLVCKAIHEGIEAALAIDRELRPKRYNDPQEPVTRQLIEIARLLYQDKDPYQAIYGGDITRCGVTPPARRITHNVLHKTIKEIVTSCLKCKQFVIGVIEPPAEG